MNRSKTNSEVEWSEINNFVEEYGIHTLFEEINAIANHEKEFHETAVEYNIPMDAWFDFASYLNNTIGSRRYHIIPVVDFNYVTVAELSHEFTEENAPVEYGEIIDYVYENTTDITKEKLARFIEFAEIEENDDRKITTLTWNNIEC